MGTHNRVEVPPCLYDRQETNLLVVGEHFTYHWAIGHGYGFHAGYVRIPLGHPWYELAYDDIPAKVHGGLTYASKHDIPGWWIGFDCGHWRDAPDPRLPGDFVSSGMRGIVRTQDYVIMECRRLCEQAAIAGLEKQLEPAANG
jgi:hypothetical protein